MQKKLRIAIVCDAIDTTIGGSIISALRFAKGLHAHGHEIFWITSKFIDETRRKDFIYATLYEFSSLPPVGPQKMRFAYSSVARLRKIFQKENIDIVYSIHPAIIERQSIRAAKKLHIPVVSHSHVWPELMLPSAPNFIKKLIKKIIAGVYRQSDGFIVPTEMAKTTFEDCDFQNKQIIISNGVDTSIFHPKLSVKHRFTLLFVGRLDQEKNIPFLIEALHLLKKQRKLTSNIHCIVVGWGSEEKKIKALVQKHGLGNVIEFTGKIPAGSSRLVKIYQEASVFILPSIYESEGMVVMEAMACGCPLLIADSPTSAAKDFVHNNGYIFSSSNPQDLADKIEAIAKNPELATLMGKVSVEYAQKFSFTLSVQKLQSFLYSFVHNK